ncbi:MAG: hypothetical protein A2Y77_12795 [Planctomycetes bacterium RBG_13_62_9]|nr:MAG: hypothetical protein A2Y77_12795 [Planctomycetes bacterium RBG_13_62_9]
MKDVVISIVNYRQPKLLDRCLAQLGSLSLPANWSTIVVDNDSGDGSGELVGRSYPWVQLIQLDRNTGYGGGHNTAFARSNSECFVVLNPDIFVLPGSLEALVSTLDRFDRAAIAGPYLLNPDGSRQYSARRFYTWRTVLYRRLPLPGREKVNDHHLMKDSEAKEPFEADWLLGAALAIRRSAFARTELFDSRYKLYFEDVDLCYFAKRQGWSVLCCPDSRMIHDHQRASAGPAISRVKLQHMASWIKFWIKSRRCREGHRLRS